MFPAEKATYKWNADCLLSLLSAAHKHERQSAFCVPNVYWEHANLLQKTFLPTLSTMNPRNGEAQAEMMNTTLQRRQNFTIIDLPIYILTYKIPDRICRKVDHSLREPQRCCSDCLKLPSLANLWKYSTFSWHQLVSQPSAWKMGPYSKEIT